MLALHGLRIDGQRKGFADIAIVDLVADDFDVREDVRRGFVPLYCILIVIPAVVILPVFFVDIQLEAIFGGKLLRVDSVHDFNAEVKRVGVHVFHGDDLADDVAGDDIHALFGEFGALVGGFVNGQFNLAGGDDVGGFADRGIVRERPLGEECDDDCEERNDKQAEFNFAQHNFPL